MRSTQTYVIIRIRLAWNRRHCTLRVCRHFLRQTVRTGLEWLPRPFIYFSSFSRVTLAVPVVLLRESEREGERGGGGQQGVFDDWLLCTANAVVDKEIDAITLDQILHILGAFSVVCSERAKADEANWDCAKREGGWLLPFHNARTWCISCCFFILLLYILWHKFQQLGNRAKQNFRKTEWRWACLLLLVPCGQRESPLGHRCASTLSEGTPLEIMSCRHASPSRCCRIEPLFLNVPQESWLERGWKGEKGRERLWGVPQRHRCQRINNNRPTWHTGRRRLAAYTHIYVHNATSETAGSLRAASHFLGKSNVRYFMEERQTKLPYAVPCNSCCATSPLLKNK